MAKIAFQALKEACFHTFTWAFQVVALVRPGPTFVHHIYGFLYFLLYIKE